MLLEYKDRPISPRYLRVLRPRATRDAWIDPFLYSVFMVARLHHALSYLSIHVCIPYIRSFACTFRLIECAYTRSTHEPYLDDGCVHPDSTPSATRTSCLVRLTWSVVPVSFPVLVPVHFLTLPFVWKGLVYAIT